MREIEWAIYTYDFYTIKPFWPEPNQFNESLNRFSFWSKVEFPNPEKWKHIQVFYGLKQNSDRKELYK